jgi:hypothetical protein
VTTNSDGSYVITNTAYLGYSNSLNVADQFSYIITDGFGGVTAGYVNIVVGTNNAVGTNSLTAIVNNGSSITVTAYGIPAYNYILERATNLAPAIWINVATNAAATNGVINATDNFNDLGNMPPASAYYRLQWQP